MRLIAVRHGETLWNKEGRQQGHLDSPLTDLGKAQAQALAQGLKGQPIDLVVSSDLGRARQTADIITSALDQKYITDPRLRERNLGCFQTFTMEEVRDKFPEEYRKFRGFDPDFPIPGGESLRQRYERTVGWAEHQATQTPEATVLAVCHGGVLMSFLHRALELPLDRERRYSLYNGAINIFHIHPLKGWSLEIWGETGHMVRAGLSTLDDR